MHATHICMILEEIYQCNTVEGLLGCSILVHQPHLMGVCTTHNIFDMHHCHGVWTEQCTCLKALVHTNICPQKTLNGLEPSCLCNHLSLYAPHFALLVLTYWNSWSQNGLAILDQGQGLLRTDSSLVELPLKKNLGSVTLGSVQQGLQNWDVPSGLRLRTAIVWKNSGLPGFLLPTSSPSI